MNTPPLVTVLMPVHNDRALVVEAARSILAQTMDDLELLVVDDGSSDGSGVALRDLVDRRVRVITLAHNVGITAALNRGLEAATGRYIARIDADDIAHPSRLAMQVQRMQREPGLVVLGSARKIVDEAGEAVGISEPALDDASIRWRLLLGNPLAHPTVMMRRETLQRYRLRYDSDFPAAEDYELWTRLLCCGQGGNLPEPLVQYRLRNGISRSRRAEQLATHDRITLLANRRFLPAFPLDAEQLRQLRGRFGGFSVRDSEMDPSDARWVELYQQMRGAFDSRRSCAA